jgi:cyclase
MTRTALLIEDNEQNRYLATFLLERHGYRVVAAADGRAAGLSPLEVAREAGPGVYADLLDPERMVGNLHRAYHELAGGEWGAPLDVAAVFGEMVEFNGGLLPACLA